MFDALAFVLSWIDGVSNVWVRLALSLVATCAYVSLLSWLFFYLTYAVGWFGRVCTMQLPRLLVRSRLDKRRIFLGSLGWNAMRRVSSMGRWVDQRTINLITSTVRGFWNLLISVFVLLYLRSADINIATREIQRFTQKLIGYDPENSTAAIAVIFAGVPVAIVLVLILSRWGRLTWLRETAVLRGQANIELGKLGVSLSRLTYLLYHYLESLKEAQNQRASSVLTQSSGGRIAWSSGGPILIRPNRRYFSNPHGWQAGRCDQLFADVSESLKECINRANTIRSEGYGIVCHEILHGVSISLRTIGLSFRVDLSLDDARFSGFFLGEKALDNWYKMFGDRVKLIAGEIPVSTSSNSPIHPKSHAALPLPSSDDQALPRADEMFDEQALRVEVDVELKELGRGVTDVLIEMEQLFIHLRAIVEHINHHLRGGPEDILAAFVRK